MAIYLAKDGLHLESATKNPPVYGSVYDPNSYGTSGGTYLSFRIDYGDSESDDSLDLYPDSSSYDHKCFAIRRA